MTNSDIPIFNENTETRNYLINLYNNCDVFTLHQLINLVDDRYYKIIELINSSVALSEEFIEAYDIVDNTIMYGFGENEDDIHYNSSNVLMKVVKKIIDQNF